MYTNKTTAALLLATLLVSCQTAPENAVIVKEEKLIKASEKPRPPWIDTHNKYPDKKDGYDYFFGVSSKNSTEQVARSDAYANAIKQIVQNVGVDVKIERKVEKFVRQKASEIINPLIIGWEKQTSIAEALVSGSKVQRWYWERWEIYQGDEFIESYWKVWVAVSISIKDLEKAKLEWEKILVWKNTPPNKHAESLISDLGKSIDEKFAGKRPIPLAIGNFKYGNTDCSSQFADDFKGYLEGHATSNKSFSVKGKIKIENIANVSSLDPNLESHQAGYMKADILHGVYSEFEDAVIVTAFITNRMNENLASANVRLYKPPIEEDIIAEGCEPDPIKAIEPLRKQDFDFRLWTDNLNGGTYKKGDEIEIYLQSSERCYVKVFNIDQSGSISVLVDKKGERLVKNIRHALKVKATQTGVETLVAIASLTRFPVDHRLGEEIPGSSFPEVFKTLRNREGHQAEYKTSLTVVE